MIWFERSFPLLMLLWPLLLTLLLAPAPGVDRLRARSTTRRLVLATLCALAAHVAVQGLLETYRPASTGLRLGWAVTAGSVGPLALWFGFAVRAVLVRRPDARSSDGGPVRSASLAPRHLSSPLPGWAWITGWLLFAACVAVVARSVLAGASPALVAGLSLWPVTAVLGTRMMLVEAEPMTPEGHAELARAYERVRRFKAWCFYLLGLGGTLAFGVVAATAALDPRLGAWVGAGLGATVGVLGGVCGAIASFRRARINALRCNLTGE